MRWKSQHCHYGFTLFEVVLYVGLTALVMIPIMSFTWIIVRDQTTLQRLHRIDENILFLSIIAQQGHQASDIDASQTVYETNPGTLNLVMPTSLPATIDTYEKVVTLGDTPVTIRKLRLVIGPTSIDLTSDAVTVESFILHNLSQGSTTALSIDLTLTAINPPGNPFTPLSYATSSTITLRQ